MIALPLEILARVLELSDLPTTARMRATCKMLDALVEADMSLEIHQRPVRDRLRDVYFAPLERVARMLDERAIAVIRAAPADARTFGPFGGKHLPLLHKLDERLRKINIECAAVPGYFEGLSGLRCVEDVSIGGDVDEELRLPNVTELFVYGTLRAAVTPTVRTLMAASLGPCRDRADLTRLRELRCSELTASIDKLQPFGPTPALEVLIVEAETLIDADEFGPVSWPPVLSELKIMWGRSDLTRPPILPPTLKVLKMGCWCRIRDRYNVTVPRPLELLDLRHVLGLHALVLTNAHLRSLHAIQLPESLRHLDVSHNSITTLREVKFPSRLRHLDCRHQRPGLRRSEIPKVRDCLIRHD
jgi:hypothetical protein